MKATLFGLLATSLPALGSLALGSLVLSSLVFGSVAAQADDRGYRGGSSNAGWRLGERNRDGYTIYRRQGGNWYRVRGSALAVADGWVLGSKRENGGYAIYRWNGYDWDQAPGGAVEIGGTYNRPWVVNNRGQRFDWNGRDWYRSGHVGNARGFQPWYRPEMEYRDRNRGRGNYRDNYRDNRGRYRFFDRHDRSWDPYRFDERRRYGKRR